MTADPQHAGPGSREQGELFGASSADPKGLRHEPALVSAAEERDLAARLARLAFEPFKFHGYLANRKIAVFGHRYDHADRQVVEAPAIPEFLLELRGRIAAFAGAPPEAFVQVLVNRYEPGAGIGWHRDRPHFGEVVGVSLLAPCTLRFRRRSGAGWERARLRLAPRSAYLLAGEARETWEHSISPLAQLRYSITLRTLARGG